MALKHMSEKDPGELTTAKEVCEKYHSPFDATSRVLQRMTSAKILKSEHGAHGGYLILKDLSKITLLDLSEMILGPLQVVDCLKESTDKNCQLTESCNIISPIERLNEKIKSFYKEISVKDIVKPKTKSEHILNQEVFTV